MPRLFHNREFNNTIGFAAHAMPGGTAGIFDDFVFQLCLSRRGEKALQFRTMAIQLALFTRRDAAMFPVSNQNSP